MNNYVIPISILGATLLVAATADRANRPSETAVPTSSGPSGMWTTTILRAYPKPGTAARSADPARETLWYGIDLLHAKNYPHATERTDNTDGSAVGMDGIHAGRLPAPAKPEDTVYVYSPRAGWKYVTHSPQSLVDSDEWTGSATFFNAFLPDETQARRVAIALSSAVAARYGLTIALPRPSDRGDVSFYLSSVDGKDGHHIRSDVVEKVLVAQVADRLTLGIVLRKPPTER